MMTMGIAKTILQLFRRLGPALAPCVVLATPALAAGGDPAHLYEHFLYLRHNPAGGTAATDSLVLVRLVGDDFVARSVYSKNNLHIDWHPLGVCRGKLYAVNLGVLLSVDLVTGAAKELDRGIESFVWSDQRLYALVRQPQTSRCSPLRFYRAHRIE